jgi:hypothetical protein
MKPFNKNTGAIALIAASSFILTACNEDDDETAQLRVLHTSPDAPAVNVYLNNEVSPTVDTLNFGESSGFTELESDDYEIDVYGITASGADTMDAVISAELMLDEETRYTVVAVDTLADGDMDSEADITAKVFTDTGELSDDSMVRVQVAHLTEGVPEVYVHVTGATDALSVNTALGSISYLSGSDLLGPVEIDPGTYRIRVSTDAAGSTVAFDSGEIALSAGSDLFIGAIPNTSGIGDSPVTLSVLNGSGSSLIYDVDDGTAVRAIHAVSDVNEVNVGAAADAGAGSQVSAFTVYTSVDFTAVADYTEIAAGSYDLGVDANSDDSADILLDGAALADGMSYTAIALGTAATDSPTNYPLELAAYVDDRRSIATAAKVRIIHASTVAGDVDLYATTSEVTSYDGLTPAFEDVPYKASTGYFELEAGTYHFTAALAGTETTGLASGAVILEAGDIVTIIARDLDSDDSETGDPVIKAIVIDETL